jgi:hypothetical protein
LARKRHTLWSYKPVPLFYLLSIGFRVKRRKSEIHQNSKKFFLSKQVQTNTENRNLKIKKIKTHHIADLFAIKEGVAQLTEIYDAVTQSQTKPEVRFTIPHCQTAGTYPVRAELDYFTPSNFGKHSEEIFK